MIINTRKLPKGIDPKVVLALIAIEDRHEDTEEVSLDDMGELLNLAPIDASLFIGRMIRSGYIAIVGNRVTVKAKGHELLDQVEVASC